MQIDAWKISLFLLCIVQFHCRDQVEKSFEAIQTPSNDDLTGIYHWDDQNIMVVGGNTWTRALLMKSIDGGESWIKDSLYDKKIFSFSSRVYADKIWSTGIDMITMHTITQYKNYFSPTYKFYRSIDGQSEHTAIAVGGEAFGSGFIDRVDSMGQLRNILNLNHELDAIQNIGGSVWLTAGFGIVLRSMDDGMNWDTLDVDGDHFRDIDSKGNISFIVGNFGTILRSNDNGKSFTKIRNASSPFVSDKAFRCVKIKDENEILVAGENGLAWISDDGGDSWKEIDNLPDIDFYDITFYRGKYFLCGSGGKILKILD